MVIISCSLDFAKASISNLVFVINSSICFSILEYSSCPISLSDFAFLASSKASWRILRVTIKESSAFSFNCLTICDASPL